MIYPINNTILAWCEDCNVYAGGPLSCIGELEGYPLVKSFDGDKFCGISTHNVVYIDNYRPSPTTAMRGGLIGVNNNDFVTRKDCIKNSENAVINSYIKPIKEGFKVQKRKTKKTIGIITRICEDFVSVKRVFY